MPPQQKVDSSLNSASFGVPDTARTSLQNTLDSSDES